MATVQDIIAEVIILSGRDDLEDNKNIILGWLNRYKLYLQRDKRIAFSEYTVTLNALANVRTIALPSDYLSPLALRRGQLGAHSITTDLFGNQFTVVRNVTLNRWIRREQFIASYPLIRSSDGAPYVGVTNDYIIVGNNIILGPIPNVDEVLYLDYYRLLPNYNLVDNTEDDFTIYYYDGLLAHCLERVFTDWVYDEKKKAIHGNDKRLLESGLRKYQVLREHPMESTLDLPDM